MAASKAGIIGIPVDVKEAGKRVDFRPDDYALLIETKGYRVAWSRASYCPCQTVNEQTNQPDPNCTICEGSGWLLFKPANAIADDKITGTLNSLQKALVGTESAIIRAVMSGITNEDQPYDALLHRLEGMLNVTVRPENRLGYHDRLVNLDTTIVYSQNLKSTAPTLKTRFPVVTMNLLRSESVVFVEGTDFNLVDGDIVWVTGKEPAEGTRLAAHYHTHPHWRIVTHPHAARLTWVKFKTKSPVGDPRELPVQAVAKYEFLL